MKTERDTSGSAFPTVEANYHNENMRSTGLTVRDYMAIHASDEDVEKILFSLVGAEIRPTRQQARYMHADAMLLERAK